MNELVYSCAACARDCTLIIKGGSCPPDLERCPLYKNIVANWFCISKKELRLVGEEKKK